MAKYGNFFTGTWPTKLGEKPSVPDGGRVGRDRVVDRDRVHLAVERAVTRVGMVGADGLGHAVLEVGARLRLRGVVDGVHGRGTEVLGPALVELERARDGPVHQLGAGGSSLRPVLPQG